MNTDFVNLTKENLSDEHLCCIIRSKKPHAGIDAKRQWLSDRLNEGHVFRKLNAKATVFIEYAPLETAWVPVIGDNYYYLYCLWVLGSPKGNGYGRALMEYCLTDAKEKGKSGVCMLSSKKQKNWQQKYPMLLSPDNLLIRPIRPSIKQPPAPKSGAIPTAKSTFSLPE